MKFGPVSVSEAKGCILAHSVRLQGRARLRKGRLISAQDVEALQQVGHDEVIVARLGATDVHEDEAAGALAAAFVPDPLAQGLEVTTPFTGRVNLLARGAGVVELDVAAIEAVNQIDPMITIAVHVRPEKRRATFDFEAV